MIRGILILIGFMCVCYACLSVLYFAAVEHERWAITLCVVTVAALLLVLAGGGGYAFFDSIW